MATTTDTVPAGDFEQQTQKFLEWFTSQPGATFHKDIKLVDLRDKSAGRGIIATAPIPADTTLFTIPRASILCATTSPLAKKLPHLFKGPAEPTVAEESPSHTADADDEPPSPENDDDDAEDSQSQDSWTLLILILMHEYLQGSSSNWSPYLSILPHQFDTPMFWTEAELAELQASALVAKVGKDEADKMIRTKIVKVVQENEDVFYPAGTPKTQRLDEGELLKLGHRMGSAIMAYAFDLAKEEDDDEDEEEEEDGWVEDKIGGMNDTMGMVPMADMLNADAVFNAHINHGEACLTATSLREIKEGEEILNYYGPLSSAELLRRYGYVTPNHARYDVVEVGWGLVEGGLKKMVEGIKGRKKEVDWAKVEELVEEQKEEEGEWEDSFVLERQSEDPDSEGQVHGEAEFMGLPEELEEQVKTYLKAVKKVVGTGDRAVAEALGNKTVRKEILLGGVRKALEEREGQYATSLEEDEKVLAGIEGGRPTTRKEMAVWVRAGEKRIIREAVAWVKKQEKELIKEKGQEKDEPSAKRRKA
ncbi:hypothetical protein NEUTE1DRAFT_58975 [Neurospora tetrasperma FGSC 2508]|uniref:SET domain-containing protein n=1 Tax=Neurospora tetrasperma (strain FGSC 2508 / ATCC MYA-4615 / P0657) TaxID=510951 RepID=F8ME45_NEUT8|nr:uncharacterized protein NEUTE1DRAFT_58975 [Neurospora tetrasperma FGSC 2508]EGO61580.1 hypothetical protein NEUTE1DRAFT_58975 [Neurospora tetrasperma FGSC 2508]EGZ74376.1 SET domain-containing protein [Neurospora tetrasperma FGSC 2509]